MAPANENDLRDSASTRTATATATLLRRTGDMLQDTDSAGLCLSAAATATDQRERPTFWKRSGDAE